MSETTAPCGCDMKGDLPPALHVIEGHPDPGTATWSLTRTAVDQTPAWADCGRPEAHAAHNFQNGGPEDGDWCRGLPQTPDTDSERDERPTYEEVMDAYQAHRRAGREMHAALLDIWRMADPDGREHMTYRYPRDVVATVLALLAEQAATIERVTHLAKNPDVSVWPPVVEQGRLMDALADAGLLATERAVPGRDELARAMDPDAWDDTRRKSNHPLAEIQWGVRRKMALDHADTILPLLSRP